MKTKVFLYIPHGLLGGSVDKTRCRAVVTGPRISYYQCRRAPVVHVTFDNEENVGFCRQHAPATQTAKMDAWETNHRAEQAKDNARTALATARDALATSVMRLTLDEQARLPATVQCMVRHVACAEAKLAAAIQTTTKYSRGKYKDKNNG